MVLLLIIFYSCTTDRSVGSADYQIDTDGDGIMDDQEVINGTDKNDPCDPVQKPGYTSNDPLNLLWSNADCDNDGISNGDELANNNDPYGDPVESLYPIPEFLPTLADLKLFEGPIADLKFNATVHEYGVSTPLFSDYAHSLRSVALPKGGQMAYNGQDLLLFPDNTILAKTLYYLKDERNSELGKKVIETQVMIKKNGIWTVGNYLWNNEQTEALLDEGANMVQIDWIDGFGNDRTLNYKVLPKVLCFQCHDNNGKTRPIGPKARALNFVHNGINQLQYFTDNGLLKEAPDVSKIAILPDWSDNTLSNEERSRAYLDVNCAHCHQPGGTYNLGYGDSFDLRFETSFGESKIYDVRVAIRDRMNTQISSYFMPLIGTTVIHAEGVALINEYIDSLDK